MTDTINLARPTVQTMMPLHSRRFFCSRPLRGRPGSQTPATEETPFDGPRTTKMDQAMFDQLQQTMQTEGPAKAIDKLCDNLRERKDYSHLFYAMLMKKRHELGLSPIPTGPSSEIPASAVDSYEDSIRSSAREVGRLFLEQGDIPGAFHYFR